MMKRTSRILLPKIVCTKGSLFSLTQTAMISASDIKTENIFTNNSHINDQLNSNLNQNYKLNGGLDKSFQHDINLYHSKFNPLKQIDISAYCSYVNKYGIAGFVDRDNIPYFNVPINKLRNVGCTSKINNKEQNELLSIYILLKLYANEFKDKQVEIFCDNVSVINMLNEFKTKQSKHLQSELLINKIRNICIRNKINVHWSRILGTHEITIDRLARSTNNPFQYSKHKPQSKPNGMAFECLDDLFQTEA